MSSKRLEVAKSTAVSAGQELLDRFYSDSNMAKLKSDRTLVTEADHLADKFIQEQIYQHFPGDGILSEEGSTIYPEKENVWIIDPLDGTVNFSLGLHYWGVSIAQMKAGYPQHAAVYFPLIDELYSASLGEGAQLNGQALHVSDPREESPYPVFVHCSRMFDKYRTTLPYKRRSLGAAAYSLCLIARGTAALVFESTPKIWDFAASWLIIQEAGGVINSLGDQDPFPAKSGMDYNGQAVTLLGAANQELMNEAKSAIFKR